MNTKKSGYSSKDRMALKCYLVFVICIIYINNASFYWFCERLFIFYVL